MQARLWDSAHRCVLGVSYTPEPAANIAYRRFSSYYESRLSCWYFKTWFQNQCSLHPAMIHQEMFLLRLFLPHSEPCFPKTSLIEVPQNNRAQQNKPCKTFFYFFKCFLLPQKGFRAGTVWTMCSAVAVWNTQVTGPEKCRSNQQLFRFSVIVNVRVVSSFAAQTFSLPVERFLHRNTHCSHEAAFDKVKV